MNIRRENEPEEVSKSYNNMMKVLSKSLIDMDIIETIFNSLNIGVWIVDENHNVLKANKFAMDLQGIDDLSCHEVTCPKINFDSKPFPLLILSKEKSIPIVVRSLPWQKKNTLISVIDISELKLAQEKLQDALIETENANKALRLRQAQMVEQEKMASIGQLASGLAHEINNPVGYIHNNLEMMREMIEFRTKSNQLIYQFNSEEISEIKEMLYDCEQGVIKITDIVQNMKTFIQADKTDSYHLTTVIPCVETAIKMLSKESKNEIFINYKEDDDFTLMIQARRLTQAFLYIIKNALQATVDKGNVQVNIIRRESEIEIEVSDTGVGLKEDDIAHVFEPFYTTREIGKGSGLGLSNAYQIIKDHKGKIDFQSKLNKGTSVKIFLPLKNDDI